MPEIQKDPRTYFAAERTFLAWIRTGLALMGIGFALARFGLFLREFSLTQTTARALPHGGSSLYSGVALVLLGVVTNVWSLVHYRRTVHRLDSGMWQRDRVSGGVILAAALAVIGVGMAAYLVVLR